MPLSNDFVKLMSRLQDSVEEQSSTVLTSEITLEENDSVESKSTRSSTRPKPNKSTSSTQTDDRYDRFIKEAKEEQESVVNLRQELQRCQEDLKRCKTSLKMSEIRNMQLETQTRNETDRCQAFQDQLTNTRVSLRLEREIDSNWRQFATEQHNSVLVVKSSVSELSNIVKKYFPDFLQPFALATTAFNAYSFNFASVTKQLRDSEKKVANLETQLENERSNAMQCASELSSAKSELNQLSEQNQRLESDVLTLEQLHAAYKESSLAKDAEIALLASRVGLQSELETASDRQDVGTSTDAADDFGVSVQVITSTVGVRRRCDACCQTSLLTEDRVLVMADLAQVDRSQTVAGGTAEAEVARTELATEAVISPVADLAQAVKKANEADATDFAVVGAAATGSVEAAAAFPAGFITELAAGAAEAAPEAPKASKGPEAAAKPSQNTADTQDDQMARETAALRRKVENARAEALTARQKAQRYKRLLEQEKAAARAAKAQSAAREGPPPETAQTLRLLRAENQKLLIELEEEAITLQTLREEDLKIERRGVEFPLHEPIEVSQPVLLCTNKSTSFGSFSLDFDQLSPPPVAAEVSRADFSCQADLGDELLKTAVLELPDWLPGALPALLSKTFKTLDSVIRLEKVFNIIYKRFSELSGQVAETAQAEVENAPPWANAENGLSETELAEPAQLGDLEDFGVVEQGGLQRWFGGARGLKRQSGAVPLVCGDQKQLLGLEEFIKELLRNLEIKTEEVEELSAAAQAGEAAGLRKRLAEKDAVIERLAGIVGAVRSEACGVESVPASKLLQLLK